MLDKKLTDEGIRFALFLCANGLCELCPYQLCIGCHEDLLEKAINLIDRLKEKVGVENESKT